MKFYEMLEALPNDVAITDFLERVCFDYIHSQAPKVAEGFGEDIVSVCAGIDILIWCLRRYGMPDDLDDIQRPPPMPPGSGPRSGYGRWN